MSSNLRVIRRKKSSLSEVKIVLFGAPGVGKSALTVRFLTKRYIGEYDHHGDQPPYKYELMVDSEPVLFELLDTCAKTAGELPSTKTLDWADGFLLVYSITDRESFSYIKRLHAHISQWRREAGPAATAPMVLVGNKGDMIHLRQVGYEEGEILARDMECLSFREVSASEQVTEVAEAFNDLCREVNNHRRKSKQSLLDRVLGGRGGLRVYARGKSDSALPKD
ncbi:Ras-like protein family member 11A [Amphibalanus amphitrite]|uniref:small monomeric GTPase n=1 Tax=Amphibalanus amphitrite TaxID=1232801 RepID=A0A6A4V9T2_AMPAM|nr:ras-related and estrogen-regulated growth inhibitor-like [Amphibalanus amphitrite]KAF0291336.1 Ras-like protein family member 11A [Amphibalanus amphitrite]